MLIRCKTVHSNNSLLQLVILRLAVQRPKILKIVLTIPTAKAPVPRELNKVHRPVPHIKSLKLGQNPLINPKIYKQTNRIDLRGKKHQE
jgi:hypothetical protein